MASHHDKTETLSTGLFSVRASDYAIFELSEAAAKFWPLITILAAVMLFASVLDWRWAVATLAVLLLIAPTMLMFAWLSLTTRHTAINSLYPHQLTLSESKLITITYFPLPPANNGQESATTFVPSSLSFNAAHCSTELWRKFIVLKQDAKQTHPILIPVSAFHSEPDAAQFHQTLSTANKLRSATII